jgi:hypothetical protein
MIDTRASNIFSYPSQLSLLYRQIEITKVAEADPKSIRKYVEDNQHQLVSMENRNEIEKYSSRSLIIEFI